uniref:Uncharacterized protein n=1 Tax=Marseillevirus LCMAC201 TaxID=2506605 RepID=A0A481YYK8_9VIRU|nr:MAG: uncharacterized protein LCMAC201_04570 [Marseillevirus LCMAC201]
MENTALLTEFLNQQDYIVAWYTTAHTPNSKINNNVQISVPVTYVDITIDSDPGYSLYPEYPLVGFTYQNNMISLLSYMDSGVEIPTWVDKYYAFVSIFDTRFGYHVRNKDGLFKKVIEALKVLNNTS